MLQKCKSTFQNWFWIGISHSVGQVPANTLSLTSPCTRTPTCYAAWVWRRCKRLNLTRATPKGSKEDRTGMPLIGLCAKFFPVKFDSDLIELWSYCFTPILFDIKSIKIETVKVNQMTMESLVGISLVTWPISLKNFSMKLPTNQKAGFWNQVCASHKFMEENLSWCDKNGTWQEF